MITPIVTAMATPPERTTEISSDDREPEKERTRKSGSLMTILGIGGGAAAGILAASAASPDVVGEFPNADFIICSGGAATGMLVASVAPRIGRFAGSCTLIGPILAILFHDENCVPIFPLIGGCLGLVWEIMARRGLLPESTRRPARAAALQLAGAPVSNWRDRLALALLSLIIGPLSGMAAGLSNSPPGLLYYTIWACSIVGTTVGVIMAVGLVISVFSGE